MLVAKDHRPEIKSRRAATDVVTRGPLQARVTMTALTNRSCFVEHLFWVLADQDGCNPMGRSLAVLYIDLDGFKLVNDPHRHGTGDALLRIVAARMAGVVRADDMLGRLGGDEFACAPTGFSGRGQMRHLARKLIEVVSAPMMIGGLTLSVSRSIGIALFPGDGVTAAALIERADAAMYLAKRQRTGHAFSARHGLAMASA